MLYHAPDAYPSNPAGLTVHLAASEQRSDACLGHTFAEPAFWWANLTLGVLDYSNKGCYTSSILWREPPLFGYFQVHGMDVNHGWLTWKPFGWEGPLGTCVHG